jgi:hypothetical protein
MGPILPLLPTMLLSSNNFIFYILGCQFSKKSLLLISLAFVHREEKIEQEKGKGAKQKIYIFKRFFFGLSFSRVNLPPITSFFVC